MFKVYKAKNFKKPPKYFHSVHGVGKLVPNHEKRRYISNDVCIEPGEVVNNGDLKKNEINSELNYNEFVVYDVG